MSKKVLFISSVLFGLVFSMMAGQCFADALAQLEQVETYKWYPAQAESIYQEITADYPGSEHALTAQKNLVISYISAKRDNDAQQTLDNLVASFSSHSALPEALYDIARIYERSRKYEKANSVYQQIIQQYPSSPQAGKAQLAAPRIEVLSNINLRNENATQTALDSLTSNFSGNSELPASVYDIARRHERANNYKKAKSLYQQIVQQYPESSSAGRAQLGIKRTNILSLIRSGQTASQEVDSLIADFTGHPDLPEALYDIALRYENKGRYDKAKDIHQQVTQQHPGTSHCSRAQLNVSKTDAFIHIESGQIQAAQTAVESLVSNFSGHSYLPAVLCDIAIKYEWAGEYEKAKNTYQQVTQQPESQHTALAQLYMPKAQILVYVDAEKHSEAFADLDALISDFQADSQLPWAVSRIAKQYYIKTGQLESQGDAEQARNYRQKAITVYEKLINDVPVSKATAGAYYFGGDCYRKLGKYEKSAQYYQKMVDDYSGHPLAWNALSLVGLNYENLEESGGLSKSEAEPKIRAAYQQLLEKYPDCKAAKHARHWLSQHN